MGQVFTRSGVRSGTKSSRTWKLRHTYVSSRHVPLVYELHQCSFCDISRLVSLATLWVMTATDDFVLPFKLGVKLTQYLVLVPLETAIEPPVREV